MENSPMKMQVADRLSGVGEYYFSKKLREIDQMRAAGKDIISLRDTGSGERDTAIDWLQRGNHACLHDLP